MRYHELQEQDLTQFYLANAPELLEKLKPFWKRIQTECSDIIGLMRQTKQALYRGVSGKPFVFEATPRTDRTPMSSSEDGQLLYDMYLERLGIKARRQSSIFVITNKRTAKGFGHLNVIFPKNDSNYCWSETHDDLIIRDFHISKLVNHKFVDSLFDQLIQQRVEVVWDSEDLFHSIALMKNATGRQDLTVWDFIDFDRMDNIYKARDTDLGQAMLMDQYTGWEIMIGSSYFGMSYLAFGMSYLAYENFLKEQFPEVETF